jgi:tetratricopeptide (TPR) repeat protein
MLKTPLKTLSFNHLNISGYHVFDRIRYQTYCHRVNALMQAQRYESALNIANRAIALYPDHHEGLVLRTMALIYLERYEDVLCSSDYLLKNQVLKHQSAINQIWVLRGIAQHRLGRHEDSYASYAQALGKSHTAPWKRVPAVIRSVWQRCWEVVQAKWGDRTQIR